MESLPHRAPLLAARAVCSSCSSGSQARSIWGNRNSSFGLLQGSRPAPRWAIPVRTGARMDISLALEADTYRAHVIGRRRNVEGLRVFLLGHVRGERKGRNGVRGDVIFGR